MKKTILLAVMCAGVAAPLFADSTNVLSDEKSKVSYAIGLSIGTSWKAHGVEVDNALFMKGLTDSLSDATPLMTDTEVHQTLNAYQKTLMAKQQAAQALAASKNKAEGDAFLATNKNSPGVITLPDGLQYKVITAGNGPLPAKTSTVQVNYTGKLLSGNVFDSNLKQGKPASFPVTGVIPGWTEALQLMPVGSKWQLYIPSNLAYGDRGHPPVIPPGSTLIFDVELLSTEAPKPKTPPMSPPQQAPLTSDIIKVPSADELKKGAKIEVIKPEDAQKAQMEATNGMGSSTNSTTH